MRLFLVMALKKEHEAVLEGPTGTMTVPIQMQWADGMVGALPVFDNHKDARAYAGDKYMVIQMAEISADFEEDTHGAE